MKKTKGLSAISEMSELTAEIEKISPLKPIFIDATFFSDRKKLLATLTVQHNHPYFKRASKSIISYKATVRIYKNTTKEEIIRQFKKRMEKWKRQPRL